MSDTTVTKVSPKIQETLILATGACDPSKGKAVADPNFSFEDIYKLTIGVTGMPNLNPEGFNLLHMSNIHTGTNFADLRGQICFNDQKPIANRKIADWIDDNCVATLSKDSTEDASVIEAKCDALYEVVDAYAEPDGLISTLKGVGYSVVGLLGVWLVFGPGMSLWKKIGESFNNRGGPGDSGSAGGGGSGERLLAVDAEGATVRELTAAEAPVEAPAGEGATAPVAESSAMIAEGAWKMLESPEVQADLKGMVIATVAKVPAGLSIPDGHIAVFAQGKLYHGPLSAFTPMGGMVSIPSINVGSLVRVNLTNFVPVELVASPVR